MTRTLRLLGLVALANVSGLSEGAKRVEFNSIEAAFRDLEYVGTADYAEGALAAHGFAPLTLPTSLEPGKHYVFHIPRNLGRFDWKMVKKRLEGIGIRITRAPKSSANLTHLYVGGPLFRIDFEWGQKKGSVFNVLDGRIIEDPARLAQWRPEDLVLVIHN